ncbi:unnamed protein product [Camellia sinensis]
MHRVPVCVQQLEDESVACASLSIPGLNLRWAEVVGVPEGTEERMKWKSTLGLMGTSEKRMLLPSAPMYSLKSFEFVGASWISEEVAMKTWKMHKQTRIFDEAMLIGCRVSVSTSEWHEMGWDILLSNVNTEPKKHKHFRSTAMTVNFMLPSHIQPFGGSFEMESLCSFRFLVQTG